MSLFVRAFAGDIITLAVGVALVTVNVSAEQVENVRLGRSLLTVTFIIELS
jgi:hypothetical protein